MKKYIALLLVCALSLANAAPEDVTYGKDGWLFYAEDKRDGIGEGTIDTIAQAVKLIESKGIKVIVLVVPEKSRIYKDKLPTNTTTFQKRYNEVIQELNAKGVDAPDFSTPMLEFRKKFPDLNLYHPRDTHWTPIGTQIIINTLKNNIIKSRINLSDLPRVEYTRAIETKMLPGDLAILSQDPQWKPTPYINYIFTAKKTDEESLLDDKNTIGIALVGSSYSQPFTTLPDALAASLKHEVVSLGIGGGGIWQPLSQYLNSETYRSNHPKLLIWEFPGNRVWQAPPSDWLAKEISPALK